LCPHGSPDTCGFVPRIACPPRRGLGSFVTVAVFVTALSGIARADVAPPSRPNPEPCDLNNLASGGATVCDCVVGDRLCEQRCRLAQHGECIACWNHDHPHGCAAAYEPQGYSKVCQTADKTVWREIWCREAKPKDDPPAPASVPSASATAAPGASVAPVPSSSPSSLPPTPGPPPGPTPVAKPPACGACAVGSPWGRFGVGAMSLVLAAAMALGLRRR
jgi:hypothetical protein